MWSYLYIHVIYIYNCYMSQQIYVQHFHTQRIFFVLFDLSHWQQGTHLCSSVRWTAWSLRRKMAGGMRPWWKNSPRLGDGYFGGIPWGLLYIWYMIYIDFIYTYTLYDYICYLGVFTLQEYMDYNHVSFTVIYIYTTQLLSRWSQLKYFAFSPLGKWSN